MSGSGEVAVSSEKAELIDAIQKYVNKSDWKAAILIMEKLFAVDSDPLIRVRIGDAYQKLNRKTEAVTEYVRAADLYASQGSVVRALAQYKLALRLDPYHQPALEKMAALYSNKIVAEKKAEPVEEGKQKPAHSVIPLFSGFTQEEFADFTKMMVVHTLLSGQAVVRQNDRGKSVYVIASGSVKVYTTLLSGEQVELAVLWPGDFFGEMSFLAGHPRTATVETREDASILEVEEEKLRDLITRRPHVLEILQKYSAMRAKGTIEKIQATNV